MSTLTKTSLRKRITGLYREWESFHSKRPRVLYHYTDGAGLLGMLKARRLWATNSRFMNDPTEVEFAARIVRETSRQQAEHYPESLFRFVMRGIEGFLKVYEGDNDEYIACFCERGDLLSQWRGYGADGGGYALGFESRLIGVMQYENLKKPEPVLRKVLYDEKAQKKLVRKFVRLLMDWERLRQRNRRGKTIEIDPDDDAWYLFNWFISEAMNCFKDPAYSEEQEWRVIQYGRNMAGQKFVETHFRASRNRIVEYVELDVAKRTGKLRNRLPLKSIRYGPTLDPKVTERALKLLSQQNGYANSIKIERSGVPFSG